MLSIENGAAFATPVGRCVVTSEIGRGTIRLAIYNVAYAEMVTLCRRMGLDPTVALQHMGHSPYIGTGAIQLRVTFMMPRQYEPAAMKMVLWQKDIRSSA
jgi:3-hydroxyisobutyrate dehydrogenase-like beta-hydroxyacid dehydrogenase